MTYVHGVSANLLYGFERFILQNIQSDHVQNKARHDIPYISAELTRLTLSAPT
jgi:hypothetical protein